MVNKTWGSVSQVIERVQNKLSLDSVTRPANLHKPSTSQPNDPRLSRTKTPIRFRSST